jgi:hypothetical protein
LEAAPNANVTDKPLVVAVRVVGAVGTAARSVKVPQVRTIALMQNTSVERIDR